MGPTCTPEFRWDFREPSSSYPFKGGTWAMPRGWKSILLRQGFFIDVHTRAHSHTGCFSRFTESNNYETVRSQMLRIYLFLRSFLFSRYRVADSRKDRCSRIAEKPPILEESVIDVVQFFPVAPFRSSMGKMLLAVIKRH